MVDQAVDPACPDQHGHARQLATNEKSKWRNVSNELRYMLGRMPTVEEVALELGIPKESWPLLKRTIESNAAASSPT